MTYFQSNMPPRALQKSLYQIAILLSLALLWSILAVSGLRSGLADSGLFLVSVGVFGLAGIWLPFLALPPAPGDDRPSPSAAALAMVLGPILPVMGIGLGVVATWSMAIVVALIVLRNRKAIVQAFLPPTRHNLIKLGGGSMLLAAFLIFSGASWRIFIPEALSLGIGQADSYFHVAISKVFATFRIPSTGGDGLAFQHYHFGSHIVAAGLAEAGASRVSLVYVYWGLILLKVQLLWGLVWSNLLLARAGTQPTALFPLFAYAWAFMLLGPLESESFMLAIAVFAGVVPLICRLFTVPIREELSSKLSTRVDWLIVVTAAFICTTTKVSVGFYCAVAMLWGLWRGRADRRQTLLLLICLAALGAYTVLLVMPFEQSLAESGIGVLLGSYAQYASAVTLVSYGLPCLVLWAYLHDLQISAGPLGPPRGRSISVNLQFSHLDSAASIYRRMTGDGLMQLHLICLFACALVLATIPIGNGMAYFSYVLLFLPALVAPAWLHAAYASVREVRIIVLGCSSATAVYLTVAFCFALATNVSTITRSAQQQTISALRDADDGPGLGKRIIGRSWRETGSFFGLLKGQLEQTAWQSLLTQIRNQGSATSWRVFVPPSADEFWSRLKHGQNNPYWCLQAHLMIPAELGTPLIYGIAPLKYEAGCSPIAGLYGFGKHQNHHRTRDMSDQQLCEVARARNVSSVYVLNTISQPEANRQLQCVAGEVKPAR